MEHEDSGLTISKKEGESAIIPAVIMILMGIGLLALTFLNGSSEKTDNIGLKIKVDQL